MYFVFFCKICRILILEQKTKSKYLKNKPAI